MTIPMCRVNNFTKSRVTAGACWNNIRPLEGGLGFMPQLESRGLFLRDLVAQWFHMRVDTAAVSSLSGSVHTCHPPVQQVTHPLWLQEALAPCPTCDSPALPSMHWAQAHQQTWSRLVTCSVSNKKTNQPNIWQNQSVTMIEAGKQLKQTLSENDGS